MEFVRANSTNLPRSAAEIKWASSFVQPSGKLVVRQGSRAVATCGSFDCGSASALQGDCWGEMGFVSLEVNEEAVT